MEVNKNYARKGLSEAPYNTKSAYMFMRDASSGKAQ